jgi:hypothetical protein
LLVIVLSFEVLAETRSLLDFVVVIKYLTKTTEKEERIVLVHSFIGSTPKSTGSIALGLK